MTKNRIREIWESACLLNEAWLKYTSEEARLGFEKMPNGLKEMAGRLENRTGIADFFLAASSGLEAKRARENYQSELQEALLDKLFNSELLAFGFRQRPSASREPVQIDAAVFEYPEIDWQGNSAEFEGKKYRAISVIDPQVLRSDQRQKTGRPSSAFVINSAINGLMKSNSQFCTQPRSIACEQIRQSIGKNSQPGNGLSDKNLEKYILAICGHRRTTK